MQIRAFSSQDSAAVIALWQACELFVVGVQDNELIASAMFGYEGHRGWVNYLAVSPTQQRRGHASALMHWGEDALRARGCPKINLQIRSSNAAVIAFYNSLGYQDDQVIGLGKRLISDL
jgi:ribosomal protein S18 acetylase RimI-like enzyme